MDYMITPCGDYCGACPRYTAQTDEELRRVAELWYRTGWSEEILAPEEIKCTGCASHKKCTYGLIDCLKERGHMRCNQCRDFPCGKIEVMLQRSKEYESRCIEICSYEEFAALKQAFFEKETNLMK